VKAQRLNRNDERGRVGHHGDTESTEQNILALRANAESP
jgi:hypothetical protein